MIAPETLAAFAGTSLLVELTPGPNMTWLALVAVLHGRRAGFAAVAGVGLGLAIGGALAAAGLAALIAASPPLWQALRWGGAAYLFWLAWDAWRDARETLPETRAPLWLHLRRGLVTNLLNPKAAVFYLAVLPAFLPPVPEHGDLALLTGTYVAVATAVHAGIVALAGSFARLMDQPSRARVLRRAMALAIAAVGVWLLATT